MFILFLIRKVKLNNSIKIKDVETKEEVKEVDNLLTELIQFEKQFNNNINEKYIVNNYYNLSENAKNYMKN